MCALRKHSLSSVHQTALQCFLHPGQHILATAPASCAEGQAFSGAVPQLDDYLRVWRYVKSSQSFNSIESSTFTEAFISQKRSDPMEVKRRAVAQIVKVMREQVRKRKVECLLRATTMTLVVDDKKDHRVILFHSNLSHEPGGSGLIQVLRIAEQSIAGHEEDYAVRMADTIERGLQLLATPLHGDPDAWVFTHLREITKHFTADGCPAVQKAGRILAQRFPNLTLVHRDHAHAIRRAFSIASGGHCPQNRAQHFLVSRCPHPHLLLRALHDRQIALGTTGPQLQVPDRSGHHRAPTR